MNEIKIKLTGQDCGIITKLIQDTQVNIIHQKITDLVKDLLLEVLEKTHGRSLWVDKKNTIRLTPAQARAFVLHFATICVADFYEQNLLRQMIAAIDQQLINNRKIPTTYPIKNLNN